MQAIIPPANRLPCERRLARERSRASYYYTPALPPTAAPSSPLYPATQGPAPITRAAVDLRVQHLSSIAYAGNTQRSFGTAGRAFDRFLRECDIIIGPSGISDDDLARFVAWLEAQPSIKSASTVDNYISNGARRYHQERGLPFPPLKHRHAVHVALRGMRKSLVDGTGTNQKLPITVPLLRQFRQHLFLGNPEHRCVWTALLCGFYALLRKANLAARTRGSSGGGAPSPSRAAPPCKYTGGVLRRCDVSIRRRDHSSVEDTWLVLHNTKTIQFGERTLELPLPTIPGDALCPTAALHLYMAATSDRPLDSQLFGYADSSGAWVPLTHATLVAWIKRLIQLVGLNPTQYAGHSLRRGGATFAFSSANLNPILIKALGDWLSASFLRYCEALTGARLFGAHAMASATLADAQ